jgi:hypothetical protein
MKPARRAGKSYKNGNELLCSGDKISYSFLHILEDI